MSLTLYIPKEDREYAFRNVWTRMWELPEGKSWRVEFKEHRNTRSNQQNRYLWGVVYPTILESGGEALRGWTKEDLHTFFLGEWSGWEELELLGRKQCRPIHTSSNLSTTEFEEYVEFIKMKSADLGIYIPDPNEKPSWK